MVSGRCVIMIMVSAATSLLYTFSFCLFRSNVCQIFLSRLILIYVFTFGTPFSIFGLVSVEAYAIPLSVRPAR